MLCLLSGSRSLGRIAGILCFLAAAAVSEAPVIQAGDPVISAPASEGGLSEARLLVSEGKFLEAKEKYKKLLSENPDPSLQSTVQKELETLNMQILFSKTLTEDSFFYEVLPGDSLYKIAKEHNTTVELIMRSNGLQRVTIYAGMKLKIVKARFSIEVDRSDNQLFLLQGGEIIKSYPVATGGSEATPIGTFEIENKLVHPTWYRAGAVVPPGSPDNILGTRWLGISIPGYGIHGTTMPETIGKSVSAGCVRMFNEDVEELYAIVALKTTVTIVD